MKRPNATPEVAPSSEYQDVDINEEYEKDPRVLKVRDSVEMRQFWNSPAGKLLENRANLDIQDGVSELLDMDPIDQPKEFRKIQLRIRVAQESLIWINEILSEGELAANQIASEDKMEGFRSNH